MIKAILFDLDNTLYRYNPPHKKAIKQVYRVLSKEIKISFSKFLKLFNESKEEIHKELEGTASAHNRVLYFQRLIEKTHKTVEPNLILKLYDAYWITFLKEMKPREETVELLYHLKERGYKIGIVSDLTTHIQLRKLKKLKLSKYIDFLVTSEEAGSEKPHAIMFLLALNKLDVKPHEAIMIGDNEIADVEGANFVGLTTILISDKKKGITLPKEDYRRANYYVNNLREIKHILNELNK